MRSSRFRSTWKDDDEEIRSIPEVRGEQSCKKCTSVTEFTA